MTYSEQIAAALRKFNTRVAGYRQFRWARKTWTREHLSPWFKAAFGTAGFGLSAFGMLRQIFYAMFLTDVVGLDPRLASIGALVGIFWDAANDPLTGILSDRVRSRWGRRRPFLLWFAIPFGLSFLIQWWAPPWESQIALAIHVTLVYMLSDTISTMISVPYYALTPEITSDYDERTSLNAYRQFFHLLGSLSTAILAPVIVDASLRAGLSQQQGYLIVAGAFGAVSTLPNFLVFGIVREKQTAHPLEEHAPVREVIRSTWRNIPFRYVTGLTLLTWTAVDLIAMMTPYFLLYWLARGDMLASVRFLGLTLSLDSAVFGLLLLVAMLCLPLWLKLSERYSKRGAFIVGMSVWVVAQIGLWLLQPGQVGLMLGIAVLAGVAISAAHVLPDAMFPDVIEWDELRTGRRQEGIYYGVKSFLRKLSGALTIFAALQVLGWSGYQAPTEGAMTFMQPETALNAIRLLVGPIGGVLVIAAIVVTWFYPLNRERHHRIVTLLKRRRIRAAELRANIRTSR